MNKIEHFATMTKGISLFFAGAGAWIGKNILAMINPPDSGWMLWLDKYGFPTVVSILFLVGIVVMFKAYCSARDATSAVQESRIADRDATLLQYRKDFTEAQSSRLELVSTNKQTVEVLNQVKEELQMIRGFRPNRKPVIEKPNEKTD